MTEITLLEKIKSRGYWEVTIRPTEYIEERFTLPEVIEKVRDSKVLLRGWDYPHISRKCSPRIAGTDYWETNTEFGSHKEIWRAYQSGLFYHIFSIQEDWLGEPMLNLGRNKYADIQPGSVLGIIMTLYRLSEIYEFATRLAEKRFFDRTCYLSIALHKTQDRKLTYFDSRRFYHEEHVCELPELIREKNISVGDLLGKSSEMSLDHCIWILNRFNMLNPPIEMLREDQKKFLEGNYR